jgi:TonB family protein
MMCGPASAQAQADYAAYATQVSKHLESKVKPSLMKVRNRPSGIVSVRFTLDGDGNVSNIRIAQTSGNAALDELTADAIRRAAPFPAAPVVGNYPFAVPIRFAARQPAKPRR